MDDPDRPTQNEAEAQSDDTIMPWIWGVIGLVLIAVFVIWAFVGAPHTNTRQPAAAAPLTKPPSQTY
jgi:hypothetical protein